LSYLEELQTMLRAGGFALATRVVNALEYGVPQSRERLLMIGVRQSFLEARTTLDAASLNPESWFGLGLRYTPDEVKAFPWPSQQPFRPGSRRRMPVGLPAELTVQHWFDQNRVTQHPNSVHQFRPRAGLKRMLEVQEGDVSKKSYKRLHRWRYAATAA
jgi:DNA (cytosine-5)-methyltransferase 1